MQLTLQPTAQLAVRAAARPARTPRSARRAVRVYAEKSAPAASEVDENIGEYCSLDKDGRRPDHELTTAEKEQLFLEAMAAFYYDEKPVLSDTEFDNLKQELQWEGSKVVVLTKEEKRLLEAKLAFKKGKPIMSDEQYEALKASLAGASVFALPREGPSCTLGKPDTPRGQKLAQAQADWLKMAALAVPPPLVIAGLLLGADLLTGANLLHLPGTVGIVVWGGLVVPTVYVLANAVSSFMFKDAVILKANCPNCGEPNLSSYFGDILTVAGSRDKNTVVCPCCASKLEFDAKNRSVLVAEAAPSS
ncbi:hypothetical protein CHLNCDRAFT_59756 [Chlorella variabilis]|uniref:PGR5-like protein 1A, chloroplastic n=1 Tax=Chlorella variabilis TaxID=554065 RepID=E1ZNF2_CHLVA|nr:hypothetical protein CHLNCDRAFT_59756 [Chlorella variabilis]EFN52597.1 hypothetical protein CHLNCDRAFT_59756 [Chlorella variabilis]|eukprot:XP_005844699.1 hypothetical protein CHLNCDRAFT_59756 [Chlorella variabilis]